MAAWVQVALFVTCLLAIAVASMIVRHRCRRQQCSVMMTKSTVIATATGLMFLVLFLIPDHFPILGIPTAGGIALIAIDVLLFLASAMYCIIVDRNPEIREYLKSLMPPET